MLPPSESLTNRVNKLLKDLNPIFAKKISKKIAFTFISLAGLGVIATLALLLIKSQPAPPIPSPILDKVIASGQLGVALSATSPEMEYFDHENLPGYDFDLATKLA